MQQCWVQQRWHGKRFRDFVRPCYAQLTVIVNGFTDSVGVIEDNLDLSRRRAEAVKKYLVDHGIAESRITCAWYAESRPAGDENAGNRRVEFIFKP